MLFTSHTPDISTRGEKEDKLNKKERFQAVREMRAPDCMPVWPRVKSQMIYGHDLMLPDIIKQDWYDTEKVTEAVLASIKNIGYDIAIPAYIDPGFGVPPLGGSFHIPNKFGLAVSNTDDQPVKTKADWPKVKKMLAKFDVRKDDPRMKAALEVIRNVSQEVGDEVALVPSFHCSISTAMFLLRPDEALLGDMTEDPEWVDEMCHVGTDFAIEWISAQYEAGANSAAMMAEGIGTIMVSPKMNIVRLVGEIKKRFNQGTWLHLHGDISTPGNYRYLTRLIKEAGVEGFHFDETNSVEWVKDSVVEKFGVPATVIVDGSIIAGGPVERIRETVKDQISRIGDSKGFIMAASCQVLPATPNEFFKAWVDATHEYSRKQM
jgi:uroporphyrinogen-III decarboxylase